jgi:hypothetical protein
MTYSEILDDAIIQSGLTLRKIEKECYVQGVDISTTYLCKLRSDNRAPASDEINCVLEMVLNIEPMKLRVAAYLERIPEQILPYIVEYVNREQNVE